MPLSGGTSGAHDDAMHQGNAKRGVANGVAAINAAGNVSDIYGSVCEITVHKDAVSGYAALDAAGALLLPGSKMYFTRDGSDDVHIYERTSNEEAYAFHRVGVDDYTFFVKESNVWKRMQTESMKDASNGIAGLDANVLLSPALLPPCMEEYSNHLGAVDNFTQTAVTGAGVVNSDAANHEMDLSTGTNVGHARFETKASWTLGTKPTVVNILVQNIVDGVAGSLSSFMGLKEIMSNISSLNAAGFRQMTGNDWRTASGDASSEESNAITALANGDLLTIVATSAAIYFFVNGALVQTHTTYIPAVGLKLGAAVDCYAGTPTTARQLSVDMMGWRQYI